MSSAVGQPVVLFLFKYQLKLQFPDFAFFLLQKRIKNHMKKNRHLSSNQNSLGRRTSYDAKQKTARGSGYVYCNFGFIKGVIAVLA